MASGNDVYCSCFRIFTLSCCAWSMLVRWRPSPWAAVVTQLVTQAAHTQAAFLSGKLPSGLSLRAQPLSVGGWPVLRDLLQSVSNPFLGGHHGPGQPGRLGSQPRRLQLEALRVFVCIRTGHDTPLPRTSHTMHKPDRLLRGRFTQRVNLHVPRSEAGRGARERPLMTAVWPLVSDRSVHRGLQNPA